MTFHSILFERDGVQKETSGVPACFVDLNLDQVIDAITAGKESYDLKPFFYTPLHDVDAIRYRHEIMQNLENPALFEHVRSFAQNMRTMREHLAQADKLHYNYQQERWFLSAVEIYCEAVERLAHDLSRVDVKSRGFLTFRAYLTSYAGSGRFTTLVAETKQLLADLSAVSYCLVVKDNAIQVRKYEAESDYSAEVEETFARFKQGAVKDYRVEFLERASMNHIEESILGFVARLHPDVFSNLDQYRLRNDRYLDETLAIFDREVQFYVAYLEYMAPFKRAGLAFCYPQIAQDKHVYDYDGFDLALAYQFVAQDRPIVCNDFCLRDQERILVVSGPNQGGKTTFARTFGQLHYMASLGCPVPGREARLLLFDRLLTHFEKEEDINTLRGKLEDELLRIHGILDMATARSIIIMNEMFASTTLSDAIFLSKQVAARIMDLDLLCVWVTFIEELTALGPKTVSVVSTVDPENPAQRTYKIVRKPADGLAYALFIAEKYRLTYDCLQERIPS